MKKTVIVCSLNDAAGTNIRERLLEKFPFQETDAFFDGSPMYGINDEISLVSSRKDIIHVDDLDQSFKNVQYVFISRHYAESGIPSLTAHFTGNFGPATFGGNPKEIARYSPALLKNYLIALSKNRSRIPESFGITLEATHHGPTSLQSPVLFVELGSTEAQWVDVDMAAIIAESLMTALNSNAAYSKCAVGIGGTHYPQKLNKLEIESEFAIGPIVPKHSLEFLDENLLKQILEKSDIEIKIALIDQKGLGKFKQEVMSVLEEFPLEKVSI